MRRFNNLWNYSVQFESLILCHEKSTYFGKCFFNEINPLRDLRGKQSGKLEV